MTKGFVAYILRSKSPFCTKYTMRCIGTPLLRCFFEHIVVLRESKIGHYADFFVKLSKKGKVCCFLETKNVIIYVYYMFSAPRGVFSSFVGVQNQNINQKEACYDDL